jgi:hypothetical protein
MFRFNEASGNALDSTANAFHLTQTGTVTAVTGQVGGGRRVTTTSQGFSRAGDAGADTTFRGDITAECWVFWEGSAGTNSMYLFSYATAAHTSCFFDIYGVGGIPRAIWHSGATGTLMVTLTSTGVVPPSVWTHVAYRRRIVSATAAYVDFFINGQIASTIGPVLPPHATTGGTGTWRAHQNITAAISQGIMDDLRISNVARSNAEILANYESSKYSVRAVSGSTPSQQRLRHSRCRCTSGSGGYPHSSYRFRCCYCCTNHYRPQRDV